jgi:hypothetical protein
MINQDNDNSRVNWRINDFCENHGVGRSFVYEEIRKGNLSIIKAGRRTLITATVANDWQARRVDASGKGGA